MLPDSHICLFSARNFSAAVRLRLARLAAASQGAGSMGELQSGSDFLVTGLLKSPDSVSSRPAMDPKSALQESGFPWRTPASAAISLSCRPGSVSVESSRPRWQIEEDLSSKHAPLEYERRLDVLQMLHVSKSRSSRESTQESLLWLFLEVSAVDAWLLFLGVDASEALLQFLELNAESLLQLREVAELPGVCVELELGVETI